MNIDFGIYNLYDDIIVRAISSASNTLNSRNIINDSNRKMLVRLVFKQVKTSVREAKRVNRQRRRYEKRIFRKNKKVERYSVKFIKRLEKREKKERRRKGVA